MPLSLAPALKLRVLGSAVLPSGVRRAGGGSDGGGAGPISLGGPRRTRGGGASVVAASWLTTPREGPVPPLRRIHILLARRISDCRNLLA
jgi:hypothetical protein